VKIFLPKDVITKYNCETPNDLIDFIGITNQVLKIQECDRNEIHYEKNPLLYRRGIPGYQYIVNFIMNRVPSDIYRFKNPRYTFDKDIHPDSVSIVARQPEVAKKGGNQEGAANDGNDRSAIE
jgi:hypothetical protein